VRVKPPQRHKPRSPAPRVEPLPASIEPHLLERVIRRNVTSRDPLRNPSSRRDRRHLRPYGTREAASKAIHGKRSIGHPWPMQAIRGEETPAVVAYVTSESLRDQCFLDPCPSRKTLSNTILAIACRMDAAPAQSHALPPK